MDYRIGLFGEQLKFGFAVFSSNVQFVFCPAIGGEISGM
jgi:hypothetical protein